MKLTPSSISIFCVNICVQLSNGPVFEWWSVSQTEKACLWLKMSNIRQYKLLIIVLLGD